MTFEVSFRECRASIKRLFPEVDIPLLEVPRMISEADDISLEGLAARDASGLECTRVSRAEGGSALCG